MEHFIRSTVIHETDGTNKNETNKFVNKEISTQHSSSIFGRQKRIQPIITICD